jgi:hypothetical protein
LKRPKTSWCSARRVTQRHHRTLALDGVRATDREPVKAPMLPASSIRWLNDAKESARHHGSVAEDTATPSADPSTQKAKKAKRVKRKRA